MAEDTATAKQRMSASLEHAVTLGLYTKRVSKTQFRLIELDQERRIKVDLAILECATRNSTDPEVAYGETIIANALTELTDLTDANASWADQQRIVLLLERLNASSKNQALLARSARLEQALVNIHGRKRSDEVTAIREMPNTSGSHELIAPSLVKRQPKRSAVEVRAGQLGVPIAAETAK